MTKTSITIPDDIYKQAKAETDNFSALVAVALEEYIRTKQIKKAEKSFGKWQKRDKASIDIVSALRDQERRIDTGRSR